MVSSSTQMRTFCVDGRAAQVTNTGTDLAQEGILASGDVPYGYKLLCRENIFSRRSIPQE